MARNSKNRLDKFNELNNRAAILAEELLKEMPKELIEKVSEYMNLHKEAMTIFEDTLINEEEEEIIKVYRTLGNANKKIIIGELYKMQKFDINQDAN